MFSVIAGRDSEIHCLYLLHRLIDLVAEDLFEAFLLQVRVVGEQAAVGGMVSSLRVVSVVI